MHGTGKADRPVIFKTDYPLDPEPFPSATAMLVPPPVVSQQTMTRLSHRPGKPAGTMWLRYSSAVATRSSTRHSFERRGARRGRQPRSSQMSSPPPAPPPVSSPPPCHLPHVVWCCRPPLRSPAYPLSSSHGVRRLSIRWTATTLQSSQPPMAGTETQL